MRTFNEVREIYENGHIVELTKEEIEKYFILKGYPSFFYIGKSNRYQDTIILETTKGLFYIYEYKIMDRLRIKEDEDDLVLKEEVNSLNIEGNEDSLRKLRLFVKSLCEKYSINFTLGIKNCNRSKEYSEEIQLQITNNNVQLFYSEIPVCPVTDEMIENTINDLKLVFKYKG